jgi:O-antigen/teichoic acid export membrane protein
LPTTEIAAPINRAVFPGFAKLATDKDALKKGFLDVLSTLAIFAIPAGVGIAIISKQLVPLMLGEKWLEAIPLIQLLAIFGAFNVLQNNCGVVYIAQGDSRLGTTMTASFSLLLLIFIAILIQKMGIIGVAWAYIITSGIIVPINFYISARRLKLHWIDYWNILKRPFIASMGMVIINFISSQYLILSLKNISNYFQLISSILLSFIFYCIFITVLWSFDGKPEGAEKYIFGKIYALKTRPSSVA